MGKLKDPKVRKTYQTEIRNKFAVLLDPQEMVLYWAQRGGRRKNGTDTWKKIEDRKEKKRKILSTRSARLKAVRS